MTREMLIRVATMVLTEHRADPPQQQAEAIAAQLDFINAVMSGTPPPAAPVRPADILSAAPAFPAANPQAMAPVEEYPPAAEPQHESLITTDLRMPTSEQIADSPRARQADPVRSLRPPARTMRVEDVNLLIQERTPERFTADIPMEDGSTSRVTFERNVISQHAQECVQLIYYPSNARTQSAREATEVQATIHVDDFPRTNLTQVMAKIKADVIESVRPKGPPREVPVRPAGGPVKHEQDNYDDTQTDASKYARAVFNTLG